MSKSDVFVFDESLRLQDIVAKIAGVSLKSTSRVLRAVHIVYSMLDDADSDTVADTLGEDLKGSVRRADQQFVDLVDKPDSDAVDACNAAYDSVMDESELRERVQDIIDGNPSIFYTEESLDGLENFNR